MKYKLLLLALALILLFSCEKKSEWTYSGNSNNLVVDGLLTNENKRHELFLSHVMSDPNGNFLPVDSAEVMVSFSIFNYRFVLDSARGGRYISVDSFIAPAGLPVMVKIVNEGKTFYGYDEMPPVSPMKRAVFDKNSDGKYTMKTDGNVFNSKEDAFWEFQIDWSFLPDYQNVPFEQCTSKYRVYNLHNIDVSQIFAPKTEQLVFPDGALVKQAKYSLSSKQAAFYRALLLETQWRGGLFDISPGQVIGNIDNGALGFFGVSTVVRDSFYLN